MGTHYKCLLTTPSPPHFCKGPLCGLVSLMSLYKYAHCSIFESRKPPFCYVRGTILSCIISYSSAITITDVCDIMVCRICV